MARRSRGSVLLFFIVRSFKNSKYKLNASSFMKTHLICMILKNSNQALIRKISGKWLIAANHFLFSQIC